MRAFVHRKMAATRHNLANGSRPLDRCCDPRDQVLKYKVTIPSIETLHTLYDGTLDP